MLAQNMFKIKAEVASKHYLHNAFAEVRFFLLRSSAFALCRLVLGKTGYNSSLKKHNEEKCTYQVHHVKPRIHFC